MNAKFKIFIISSLQCRPDILTMVKKQHVFLFDFQFLKIRESRSSNKNVIITDLKINRNTFL